MKRSRETVRLIHANGGHAALSLADVGDEQAVRALIRDHWPSRSLTGFPRTYPKTSWNRTILENSNYNGPNIPHSAFFQLLSDTGLDVRCSFAVQETWLRSV